MKPALISVSIAAFASLVTANASADDVAAPCKTISAFLRAFAGEHPDQTVDTGNLEFLRNALHLFDDSGPKLVANVDVDVIRAQSFDKFQDAISAIGGVALDTKSSAFLKQNDIFLDEGGFRTYVRDLRPLSNHVVISQNQGTLDCEKIAVFRPSEGKLIPTSVLPAENDLVCLHSALTALKVGEAAFPAIVHATSSSAKIDYTIGLVKPEGGPISEEQSFCTVEIKFNPISTIQQWLPGPSVDPQFFIRLRSYLEPLFSETPDGAHLADLLGPMRAQPSGNSAFDGLLTDETGGSEKALAALDPAELRKIIPNAEAAGEAFDRLDGSYYPVDFDHHHLLIGFGDATLGWRILDDAGFGVWEWDGAKLVPLIGGYMGKRANQPLIQ